MNSAEPHPFRILFTLFLILLIAMVIPQESVHSSANSGVVLVIHGGAGTIERASMTTERDAEYRAALAEALVAADSAQLSLGRGSSGRMREALFTAQKRRILASL